MENFSNWFCLNRRPNFTIDAQINPSDAQYYFGRDDTKERLRKQVRRAFIDPGVPKMMIYGPYGSGKTQTLFYLQYFLEQELKKIDGGKPHLVYVPVEMGERSKASNLHMQLMQALGKEVVSGWVRKLFEISPDLDVALGQVTSDPNVAIALRELRAPGEGSFSPWRWLTCQGLGARELSQLGLTADLSLSGSKDMAETLVALGHLTKNVNEILIFLIDEMESLQNVRAGDAAESIHLYIRNLAEKKNSFVGFLIGFKADVSDDAPEILRRSDVMSRIGNQNFIDIPPLPAIADVKTFIKELLKNLTEKEKVEAAISEKSLDTEPGIFPFEQVAFEQLADYATQDITRALPRNIINAINECAIQAWDESKPLIDQTTVDNVAPFIFQ
jgi:Cdc6-like AAA superfamily ATPase